MSGATLIALLVGGGLAAILGVKLLMMLLVTVRGDGGGLVLGETVGDQDDEDDAFRAAPGHWERLVGQSGQTLTDLRLSGKAIFSGEVYDVLSAAEYIDRGEMVTVVGVEGSTILVERAAP